MTVPVGLMLTGFRTDGSVATDICAPPSASDPAILTTTARVLPGACAGNRKGAAGQPVLPTALMQTVPVSVA